MHGQTATVTQTTVATNFAQTLDVHSSLTAQVAFDDIVMLDSIAEQCLLVLGQVLNAGIGVDTGLGQNLSSAGRSDAIDIGQSNFDPLVAGKINTRNTCHFLSAPPISLVSACAWGFRKLP